MKKDTASLGRLAINAGLTAGGIAVLVSLVGLVESFSKSYIIQGVISLGEPILFFPIILLAYSSIRRVSGTSLRTLVGISALIGLVAGLLLSLLVIIGTA